MLDNIDIYNNEVERYQRTEKIGEGTYGKSHAYIIRCGVQSP